MGSGKTVVGALVAQRGRTPFFDLDHLVEDKAGMSIAEIFATHSEEAFRAFEKETLPGVLQPGSVVALGGGVVVDDDNWRLIASRALTVYLEVPFETIWQRIHHLPGRPLIFNRTKSEIEALYELRLARYQQADHRVDGMRPAGDVADEVLKLWSG
jgi:shikimate kinase